MRSLLKIFGILTFALLFSCNISNNDEQARINLEKNKNIIGFIYKMFETGDTTGLENYVAQDMMDHTLDPLILQNGIEGLKELIHINHTAFPDLKVQVYNISAEGDLVYTHFNFKGINSGPIRNSAPTMQIIDINGVDILHIKDGRVIEHWGYWDTQKFINQLSKESN